MAYARKRIALFGLPLLLTGLLVTPSEADAKKPKAARDVAVAVFPFKVLNPEPKFAHFGEGAADAVINQIVREGALKIVEESQLDKAVKTLSRNASGLFEEDSALSVGKMVDARFIVIGSVDVVADQIAISSRVIEVETRQLLVADRVHGPLANSFSLYEELARRTTSAIQRHLAVRVTGGSGDNADAAAVKGLLKTAKRYDPAFGGDNLRKALEFYKKAVLRDPNNATTRFALGQALAQAASYGEAKHNLEIALQLDDKYIAALCWLGYTEDKLGNAEQGRQLYERAIDIDPDSALARYWLAANLANAGRLDEARVHAETAHKLGEKRAGRLLGHITQRIALQKQKKEPKAER